MQPTYKFICRVDAVRSCARMLICNNNHSANNILVKNKPRLTPLGQAVFVGKWNPPSEGHTQCTNQRYQCCYTGYFGLVHHVVNKYEVKQPE